MTSWKLAIPVLHVMRSAEAVAFYCEALGFRLESVYRPTEGDDPGYVALRRDGARVHLSSFAGDGKAGGLVYLLVDDVDALFAELQGKGVPVDMPPTDQTWGNREMYVRDADGNKIAFVRVRGDGPG